jgi:serine/threonine protein kinase
MATRSGTAWKDYCGRERAALRKRRTKTKCNDFSILSQIGQGGYGQVFLARKKDTHEVVALKKMNVPPPTRPFLPETDLGEKPAT